ncbi:MAG: flippase-like domain-containing protein [Bacteroidales bacterium]|nr:flippase-like domain-containing protein [Bacteroidales bacterium]
MKKIAINGLKYFIFLAIGVLIFWSIYKNIEWKKISEALRNLKYEWIILSLVFNMMAQISRAYRWKMLIKPLGHNPSATNTFLSVFVMYFVNLILPRAGEVARCTVISRTDKIPFTKLVGTVFTERLADMIALFFLVILIFALNLQLISGFFRELPIDTAGLKKYLEIKYILLLAAFIILMVAAFLYFRKRVKKSSRKDRLVELKNQLIAGIISIRHMEKKWLFILHTANIFLMWLFMLWVVFLSFGPTEHVSLKIGMVVFLLGGLVMIIPVQGGVGTWHGTIAIALVVLLNNKAGQEDYEIFALIAHTVTNMIYIVLGAAALFYFWIRYGNDFLVKPKKQESKVISQS